PGERLRDRRAERDAPGPGPGRHRAGPGSTHPPGRARRAADVPALRGAGRPRRPRLPTHRRRVTAPDPDLEGGELQLVGRLTAASNATFVGTVDEVAVVYKPVAGERPLWDFPDGTLAHREVAAYLVARALDWDVV